MNEINITFKPYEIKNEQIEKAAKQMVEYLKDIVIFEDNDEDDKTSKLT